MEIVTGYTGSAHITSEQDKMLNRAILGNTSVVLEIGNQLDAELVSNNEIRIKDGGILHQGCFSVIPINTYKKLDIQNGEQGKKRVDYIVARYSKNTETGVESETLLVLTGESGTSEVAPTITSGDIADGALCDDFLLYAVHLDGINVTNVEAKFAIKKSMVDVYSGTSTPSSSVGKNGDIYVLLES